MAPPKGYRHTLAEKRLMRKNHNKSGRPRKPLTPEQRANISKGKLASGYRHSQETIEKIRASNTKKDKEQEQEEYLISLYSDEEKEPDMELIEDESYSDLYEELKEY